MNRYEGVLLEELAKTNQNEAFSRKDDRVLPADYTRRELETPSLSRKKGETSNREVCS